MKLKKSLLACVSIAGLLAATAAFAQLAPALKYVTNSSDTDVFQDIPNGIPGSVNSYITGKVLRSYIFGSGTLHTGTPALTGCSGGGGTLTGTDYAMILTGGTTATTSCIATFSVAYASVPVCVVSSQTAYATTTPSFTVSTTAVTITQASQASEVYDVICVAKAGG